MAPDMGTPEKKTFSSSHRLAPDKTDRLGVRKYSRRLRQKPSDMHKAGYRDAISIVEV